MASAWADAADGGFSEPKEIESRLNAARAQLAALPPDSDPESHDFPQRLVASGEYHLSSVGVLAAAREQITRTKEENSSWKKFASPPPYPVGLHDEIRESFATLENSQRISEVQIRIFKREIESLGDLRAKHLQTERQLLEAAEDTRDWRMRWQHS